MKPTVLEICAGAGGQAVGLEAAGFDHVGAIEIEPAACATLRLNRPDWHVIENDVRESLGNVGVFLGVNTGANTVISDEDASYLIVDRGVFDCNGDGIADANIIRVGDDDERSDLLSTVSAKGFSASVLPWELGGDETVRAANGSILYLTG